MNIDKVAQTRINELEAELAEARELIEDREVLIDLQQETIDELQAENRVLRAQHVADKALRKVDYGVG